MLFSTSSHDAYDMSEINEYLIRQFHKVRE